MIKQNVDNLKCTRWRRVGACCQAYGLSALVSVCSAWAQSGPPCLPGTVGKGDFDGRGDISLVDFAAFSDCLGGPGVSPPGMVSACLAAFDWDGDADVDLLDYSEFMRAFTGACAGLGECPPGMHLVHESGEAGVISLDTTDTAPPDPVEYECVPDDDCTGIDCSGRGACMVMDGQPVCACDTGYAGADCGSCAVGYEFDPTFGGCALGAECRQRICSGQGTCIERGLDIECICDPGASGPHCEFGIAGDPGELRPPRRIQISNLDSSLEYGESRALIATLIGDGRIDENLVWSLNGPGQLAPRSGLVVTYTPPPPGEWLTSITPEITVCSESFPDNCTTRYILVNPPGTIRSTGHSHNIFKCLDDMMVTYMRQRCVGGAVLGVSLFGKVVYLKGYGNLSGAPTSDPSYCAECGDTFDVSSLIPTFPLPPPAPVKPNSPFRIGSNSKAITAAILRKAVKNIALGGVGDDDDVEAALVCDPGLNLLPPEVRAVMCNGVPPPVPLPNEDSILDDPVACADLSLSADTRWANVKLGHLMGHRSGLPRSVPDYETVVLPNLGAIRGYDSEGDWGADETLLESDTGFPTGTFANEFPMYNYTDLRYFFRVPFVHESILARLGGCLAYPPGGPLPPSYNSYSNTGFSIQGMFAEWLTGERFQGYTGKPGYHAGSLLDDFLTNDLGFPVPTQLTNEGIFYSQDVYRLRDPNEPIYRVWSVADQTYYPLRTDLKRPACNYIPQLEECDITLVENWDFTLSPTLIPWTGGAGNGPSTAGALSAEAEAYLRFMSRYWVGGDGNNPRYGETRCPNGKCIWTMFTGHNGAREGTWSEIKQIGGPVNSGTSCGVSGACPTYRACMGTPEEHTEQMFCLGGNCYKYNEYKIPPLDICTGLPTDDFANMECHTCRAPVGVDFFVAVNQRTDKKCRAAEALPQSDPNRYTCDGAYGAIVGYISHALCKIDFPPNPYVLWPTVLVNGESGMGPQISAGRGDEGARAGGACCGNGIQEAGEECDGADFGGQSCASFGFELGNLSCNGCVIDTQFCYGGVGVNPPASYVDCDYTLADCDGSPSGCNADGDCLGGPCARTDPGDFDSALFDPFNYSGEFHPDGNFRDEQGNLYYCRDDTPEGPMECIDVDGWGVCMRCDNSGEPLTTKIGCPCDADDDCLGGEPNLTCWGDEFPGATGFCWDIQTGPPSWQCPEGTCGMSPGYVNDEMYCEHYSLDGEASCQPWYACNAILARVCSGENVICAENAGGCTSDDCCASACQTDDDCSPAFGWPPGYTCENTPEGLQCVP